MKIEFDYEIYNHNNEKISTGNSVLAFIDMKTNKPIKCPDYILEKLNHLIDFICYLIKSSQKF